MRRTIWLWLMFMTTGSLLSAAQGRGGGIQAPSPASQRRPPTVTPQTFDAAQVQLGENRFAAQCAFCHGSDSYGGEGGPDLSRSTLVAEDVRGDRIGPVVRQGRQDKGMPALDIDAADLAAIVAFIHTQKLKADPLGGGRRSVDVGDLQTGNAEAGREYFNGAGNCSKCHSATGDLAGIGSRFQGLPLLQRLLYPTAGRPAPAPAKASVTLASGEVVDGSLVSRSEFSIVLTDLSGMRRTFSTAEVKFTIDDPLSAHWDQLGKYSDNDMHNVFAYLQTLR
jgi:cytochrome c oxidase cbb3-type subunit 3